MRQRNPQMHSEHLRSDRNSAIQDNNIGRVVIILKSNAPNDLTGNLIRVKVSEGGT
jgi:hypothetical protein